MHEFIEEYKNAHNLKEKTGPGRAKLYDPRGQPRREAPAELPMTGCSLARLGTGVKPERQVRTSSKAIGGWWDDPIFKPDAHLKDVVLKPGERGPRPPCLQKADSARASPLLPPMLSRSRRDAAPPPRRRAHPDSL